MRVAAVVTVAGLAFAGIAQLPGPASAAAPMPPVWQSVQSAGGTILEEGIAATVLGTGTPVIAGTYMDTAYFPTGPAPDDSIALTGPGSTNVFIATLDQSGSYFTWAQRAFGALSSVTGLVATGSSTATALDDTLFITGTYSSGTMYFPTGVGDDSIALSHVGINPDMYVAALRPGGGFAWALRLGPATSVADRVDPIAMTIGASGAPVITGAVQGTIDFPGNAGPIAITSTGFPDAAFIAAMNADDSTFAWVQQAGGSASTLQASEVAVSNMGTASESDDRLIVSGLVADGTAYFPTGRPAPDDSMAVTADAAHRTFVAAMNADDTYFAWVQSAGGTASTVPSSLATAPDGSAYLSGYFFGSASFPLGPDDSVTLTAQHSRDAYVARMSVDDSYFSWASGFGGTGIDEATGIALTSAGIPVVTGRYRGPVELPSTDGTVTLPAGAGGDQVFVAAMDAGQPTFTWAQRATGANANSALTSRALAPLGNGTAVVVGNFSGTALFPASSGSLSVESRGSRDVFAAIIGLSAPTPAAPQPPVPSSAPRDVVADAGDAAAVVSWRGPESPGSFAVSHYLATSSPGNRTCLAAAPALTCEVLGLTNGTSYTFTVKALTGAGWSSASEPSNVVVPRIPAKPTIVISGTREGKRIVVSGVSTGVEPGTLLTPHVARSLEAFRAGVPFTAGADGSVNWSRRASTAVFWRVYVASGDARSNTITIR